MKSFYKIILLGIILLTMTGCAGNSSSPVVSQSVTGTTTGTANTTAAIPELSKLVVGTFKLEGTENAIKPQQATELLFLWQGYKELTGRDSAADEEKEAIIRQVKENMTEAQLSAIESMNLSQEDIRTVVMEYGSNRIARESSSSSSTGSGGGFGGGMPGGGGMMMGGGMPPDGGAVPPDMASGNQTNSTNTSTNSISGTGIVVNQLLDPLITLLGTRINE